MSDANTILIISDKQDLIKQISQKLVLLRNLDKIQSCAIAEAQNLFDDFAPNVVVLHCCNNNQEAICLIKKIKKHDLFKNVPILLLNENCSRETVIDAFDNGVSDVLFMPVIDYELLIRIIWCLQKNELNLNIESKNNFLTSLGIIQENTGAYSPKYYEEFLKNEIAQSKKYSQRACILLISPDKKYPAQKTQKEFTDTIRKSVRLNDSIAIKDEDKFYIYLQKTKLNGAYSVFERINTNLGIDAGINAGVVEVQEQKFEDIIEALDAALNKANENSNSLIVASDFYANERKNIGSILNPDKNFNFEEETVQIEEVSEKKPEKTYDKTSIMLFNQAYKRKIKFVITPVFRKYQGVLEIKRQDYMVDSYIGNKSLFSVTKGNIKALLMIEYDGVEKTLIRLSITNNDQRILYETENIDFTILDHHKLSRMLSNLIDKFMIVAKRD